MAKEKFIRRPDFASGDLTPDEKSRMDAHANLWIERAYRTAPIDPDKIIPAIRGIYSAAGMNAPRVVIVPSPIVLAFAYGLSAAILWARKNPTLQATWQATEQATWQATRQATLQATRQATEQATGQATGQATRQATRRATEQATLQATGQATRRATEQATWQATGQATEQATWQATWQATLQATLQATDQATGQATEQEETTALVAGFFANCDAFGVDRVFASACANNWYVAYQGGNMWAGYDAYLSAARDVLKLKLPVHEKYGHWETAAIEGGFRVMHEEFSMVCDFPEIISRDSQNRPHSNTGPSHRWRDGWSLYHIHGVRVPEYVVTRPQEITIGLIRSETNAEVRRVMIGRYGYSRYCKDAGLTLVDSRSADDPLVGLRTAKLWRDDANGICLLDVLNSTPEPDGTTKRYTLAVDADAYGGRAGKDVLAAAASTWRRANDYSLVFAKPEDYAPVIET